MLSHRHSGILIYMKPHFLAIRSIGAEFANRVYIIVTLIASMIAVSLLALTYWLTTVSSWWWLLMIVLIIILSIITGVLVIIKMIIRSVTPSQSSAQKTQTKAFVDKLEKLSETVQTPKFILLFQLVRDIAAPRDNGLVASLSTNTASLKHDFTDLINSFKQ